MLPLRRLKERAKAVKAKTFRVEPTATRDTRDQASPTPSSSTRPPTEQQGRNLALIPANDAAADPLAVGSGSSTIEPRDATRPPQAVEPPASELIALRDLWKVAHDDLDKKYQELLAQLKTRNLTQSGGATADSSIIVKSIINDAKKMKDEDKESSWRPVLDKIIDGAVKFKALGDAIVKLDKSGYAALAWSVTSFGLEIAKNAKDLKKDVLSYSEAIPDTIARYAEYEYLYRESVTDTTFEELIAKVYKALFLYMIALNDYLKQPGWEHHGRASLPVENRTITSKKTNIDKADLDVKDWLPIVKEKCDQDRHAQLMERLGQAAHFSESGINRELSEPINKGHLPCHYIQLPKNNNFVGRDDTLDKLKQNLFIRKQWQRAAIVGLGGVGKTQVALQLAYWAKKHQSEYSVFFVSALSQGSFEQAYTRIARELRIQRGSKDDDLKESVQRHLGSEAAGPWLLVVDNADDRDVLFGPSDMPGGINEHLPESEGGLVLFTTRSQEVAVSVAGSNVIELHEMDPSEAASFLEKSLVRKDLLHSDESMMAELLEELTYLPLAITQAAAYINTTLMSTREPIAEYLKLLRGTEQEVASLMSREFHDRTRHKDSQNAVAATWLVSFRQIRKSDTAAADLLSFISCIEPKAIPQSILPRLDLKEQMGHAIGTLCGCAFLTRRGNSEVFDMHSLVHLATRIWIQGEDMTATMNEKAIRQLVAVFPNDDYANRSLWREYLPHAFKVLQHCEELDIQEKFDLLHWIGRCLMVDGRIKEAVRCLEEDCRRRNRHFLKEHPLRLLSQHSLAIAYRANGQVKEAIAILQQVVAIEANILAKDHPNRLVSQNQLAIAYQANGQLKKAIALFQQIVAIEANIFAKDHPGRLSSQHSLAVAYQVNGQFKEAIALLQQVIAIEANIVAEDHPDRLASQYELAKAYHANGQVKEAITLLQQVVAITANTFAEDHPLRRASQGWLTYELETADLRQQ